MTKDNGGPAFPWCGDLNECPTINLGMTMRDWFATFYNPTDEEINRETSKDRAANPYNDYRKPKLRDRLEIICYLKYKHADAMIRAKGEG